MIITRSGAGEPERLENLVDQRIAFPATIRGRSPSHRWSRLLDEFAPGWVEVPVADDTEAVWLLVEDDRSTLRRSRHVYSGPQRSRGGRTKGARVRPPGNAASRHRSSTPASRPQPELSKVYYGCVMTRTDSGINRLEDLNGSNFAFSDETSTSGHIFARALLQRRGVELGHILFAGGHPNVVQAVRGRQGGGRRRVLLAAVGRQPNDGTMVGDARFLILKNMATQDEREELLDEVRIIALTDPIPNDVCCVRRGFPETIWAQFEASMQRFLETPDGRAPTTIWWPGSRRRRAPMPTSTTSATP